MLYEEISYDVIGAAMKVHSVLGSGFPEVFYQNALAIEMNNNEIKYEREKLTRVYYKGIEIGTRKMDFFVEGKLMIELKAVSELNDSNLNQSINYLEAFNLPVGLLINFGARKLDHKRIYNSKHKDAINDYYNDIKIDSYNSNFESNI
jgi:GxxExxY protein